MPSSGHHEGSAGAVPNSPSAHHSASFLDIVIVGSSYPQIQHHSTKAASCIIRRGHVDRNRWAWVWEYLLLHGKSAPLYLVIHMLMFMVLGFYDLASPQFWDTLARSYLICVQEFDFSLDTFQISKVAQYKDILKHMRFWRIQKRNQDLHCGYRYELDSTDRNTNAHHLNLPI